MNKKIEHEKSFVFSWYVQFLNEKKSISELLIKIHLKFRVNNEPLSKINLVKDYVQKNRARNTIFKWFFIRSSIHPNRLWLWK